MFDFLFIAITTCSLLTPTQTQIEQTERSAAKKEKCSIFKENHSEKVTCTEGGQALLIHLECFKTK